MLSGSIRILNFDDSLKRQAKLIERFRPDVVDLKEIGPSSRLWMNKRTAQKVKGALMPDERRSITFLGSGDFHHVSHLLIEQFEEPMTLILFDHHPDWDILPPRIGCGSWVSRVLKRSNIKKVVMLGVSSNDISSISIQTGDLDSLRSDRVEIYPYEHRPTRTLFKRVPENISIELKKLGPSSRICWQELKDKALKEFFLEIIGRLETKQVYVSIDKDCLRPEYSLTNWEKGNFKLEELLMLIGLVKDNLDIIGLDITGDYSPPHVRGGLKALCSRLDHPRDFSAKAMAQDRIDSINEETNIKILELLKDGRT